MSSPSRNTLTVVDAADFIALMQRVDARKAALLEEITVAKADRDAAQQSGEITLADLAARNAHIKALQEEYGVLYWSTHPNPKKRALAFGPPAPDQG